MQRQGAGTRAPGTDFSTGHVDPRTQPSGSRRETQESHGPDPAARGAALSRLRFPQPISSALTNGHEGTRAAIGRCACSPPATPPKLLSRSPPAARSQLDRIGPSPLFERLASGAQWASPPPRCAAWSSCFREPQIRRAPSIWRAWGVEWDLSGACRSSSPLAETACPVGRPASNVRCRVSGLRTAGRGPDGGRRFHEPIECVQNRAVTGDRLARGAVGCGRRDRRKR